MRTVELAVDVHVGGGVVDAVVLEPRGIVRVLGWSPEATSALRDRIEVTLDGELVPERSPRRRAGRRRGGRYSRVTSSSSERVRGASRVELDVPEIHATLPADLARLVTFYDGRFPAPFP